MVLSMVIYGMYLHIMHMQGASFAQILYNGHVLLEYRQSVGSIFNPRNIPKIYPTEEKRCKTRVPVVSWLAETSWVTK